MKQWEQCDKFLSLQQGRDVMVLFFQISSGEDFTKNVLEKKKEKKP